MHQKHTDPPLSDQALSVPGIRIACACAGLYPAQQRLDMVLLEARAGSRLSITTTRNRFAACPIHWCRKHQADHRASQPSYLLINAGNANAGTGQRGMDDVQQLWQGLTELTDCPMSQFLPFSTGVIGEYLPVNALRAQLPELVERLSDRAEQWHHASQAILTTDTTTKLVACQWTPNNSQLPIHLVAIAKGSGMIHPDMATMLCFMACDVEVDADWFDQQIRNAVNASFNCISVDGDTSTNDACLAIASGARAEPLDEEQRGQLSRVIERVFSSLAQQIVADGEGARLSFTVQVIGAADQRQAKEVAKSVATSPLVKTALGARDANWGRILAAVGRAPIEHLAIDKVNIFLNQVQVVCNGQRDPGYQESQGAAALQRDAIDITIDLADGEARAHYHGCDLSQEYVRINSDYRS